MSAKVIAGEYLIGQVERLLNQPVNAVRLKEEQKLYTFRHLQAPGVCSLAAPQRLQMLWA